MAISDLIAEQLSQYIISPKVISYFGSKLNEVKGRFVSANRVYNFVLDKKGVSYSPAGQGDSLLFSALYLRQDAVRKPKIGNSKCNAGKSYQCGKSCISNYWKCKKGVRDVNDARRIASILASTNEGLKNKVKGEVSDKAIAKGERLRDNKVKGQALLEGKGKVKANNLNNIKKLFNKPEDKQIVSDFADLLHPSTLNMDMREYPKLFEDASRHIENSLKGINNLLVAEDRKIESIDRSNRLNNEDKKYQRSPEMQKSLNIASERAKALEQGLADFQKAFRAKKKELENAPTQKLSVKENYKKETVLSHLGSIPFVQDHSAAQDRVQGYKSQARLLEMELDYMTKDVASGDKKLTPKRKKEFAEKTAKLSKLNASISSLNEDVESQKPEIERLSNQLGYTVYPLEGKNIVKPKTREEKSAQMSSDVDEFVGMLDREKGFAKKERLDLVRSDIKTFLDKNKGEMSAADIRKLESALGINQLARTVKSAQGSVDEPRLKSANP